MTISDIRKSAREALAGKWTKGVLIMLAYLAFSMFLRFVNTLLQNIPFINLIVTLAIIIISVPISFGLIVSFIKLKRGEDLKAFDFITYGLNNLKRSWKISLKVLSKTWLQILLNTVATIALAFILLWLIALLFSEFASIDFASSLISTIVFILYLTSLIYLYSKLLSYSLVYLIGYDNEEMSAKDLVEESAKLMHGNKIKFLLLQFSFIGWIILSAFTFYIGLLWVIPYMQISIVCFYEALKDKKIEE